VKNKRIYYATIKTIRQYTTLYYSIS